MPSSGRSSHFDALVIGAGPGGSVAALVLARSGARVALVDKASFPRDKACGDLVGPRGVQVLDDLNVPIPPGPTVGDMVVAGPTGRRVRLPSAGGFTYPGHGVAVARVDLDTQLWKAALDAGAVPITARADRPVQVDGRIAGFATGEGQELFGDAVIGADGATSRVASSAGLVDSRRVLWGFAVRAYVPQSVALPTIVLWDRSAGRGFPGYGWAFPAAEGANVGLGVATLGDRQAGALAVEAFPDFLAHLRVLGIVPDLRSVQVQRRLGGWLKMGMVGTEPSAERVLLVGDAAGLVNPLQGEGIAHAMRSGLAAAESVLAGVDDAANSYRARLAGMYLPYERVAAGVQAVIVRRPRLVSGLTRSLTARGVNRILSGGWAVFWNDLLDGAPPSRARSVAEVALRGGQVLTEKSAVARWFARTF